MPQTGSIGDWTKTRPATVVDPGAACREIAAAGASCSGYRLSSAVTAGYTQRTDPARHEATLTQIDAATIEDAVALFLCLCPGANPSVVSDSGGAVDVRRVDARTYWTAWRGHRVVSAVGNASERALERLGGRLLLATPGAPLPASLPMHVFAGQAPARLWAVRSVAELVAVDDLRIDRSDADLFDQVLGLSKDRWLVCAALNGADSGEMNYHFTVRYPSVDAARVVYARCMEAVAGGEVSFMLAGPIDDVLVGSWTPDVESVSHHLSSVRHRLQGDSLATASR